MAYSTCFAVVGAVVIITCSTYVFRYSKTEDLEAGGKSLLTYSHLLVGVTSLDREKLERYVHTHVVMDTVPSFTGWALSTTFPYLTVHIEPTVWILKRRHRRDYREEQIHILIGNMM